ncbi:MAG TPA: tetratricopeptide repeat protein, partial [Thermoanaerobaculia bacterium]|nr:tetratricopeptide repeat protein [Thermoanaerobaculia bacterium]
MPILLHFIRSFHRARRCVSLPSLVFVVAAPFLICPVGGQEPAVRDVRSGSTWEGPADGRKTHDYELPLAAGTYLFLEVEQFGADVSATLHSPGGGRTVAIDGPEGPRAIEILALITDAAGAYRLSVTFRDPRPSAGRYLVRVRESRPARDGDELRVKAVSALAESQRLRSGKEPDGAAAKAREALELWGRLADGLAGEAEALNELGQIDTERGEHAKALAWFEKGLQRSRESGYLAGEAWSLSNSGFSNMKLGRFDAAIEAYKRSFELWTQIGRVSEQAFVLRCLGRVHYDRGEHSEALRIFDEALSLAETAEDLPEQAVIWNSISAVHFNQGRLTDALKALEQALALSRQVEETRNQMTLESNLAVIYTYRGQFQKAVEMWDGLIGRARPKDQGLLLHNLGGAYLELGDPKEALDCYQRALAVYQSIGEIEGQVNSLTSLGMAYLYLQEPQTALRRYEEARALAPEETWSISYSIGLARLDLKEPQLALEALDKALKAATAIKHQRHTALTLLAMGSAYRELGDTKRAAEKLGQAIDLGTELEYSSVVAPGLLRRARLWRDEGRLTEALADIEKALDTIESTWRSIAGDDGRTSFMASKRTYYEVYVSILMRLDTAHPEAGYKRRALEASERARARGLLNLLAEGRVDVSQGLAADLRRKEDELLDEFSLAQRALRDAQSADELKGWRAKLDELDKRRKSLDLEIREKHPRYAEVRYPVPRSLPEIQRDLDGRTALLEYALSEEGSTLFVVTREDIFTYQIPSAGKIAEQVRRLRATLEQENRLTRNEYLDSAFRLYQDLIAPAADVLEGKPNLLIAPDGSLYYAPFEAFLTAAAGDQSYQELPYLVREHSVTYIPSASVLAGLREPAEDPLPASRKLFVAFAPFAEPEKGSENGVRNPTRNSIGPGPRVFVPLPSSREEVSGIASLYSGSSLYYIGKDAKEETVKSSLDVPSAQRLHFATHAELNETYPELSALVLANSAPAAKGEAGDDGFLNVQEIFNLKLSAEFVVLSACETGLGKEVTGEGLIGLTRAFFYAGVPSLIVSLWNVT